ncbi:hypothetical protein L208DRAFT_1397116 [Tricholoma matsutake]|nr:hypothetical protein L208DRAFT_1397116 [Tricholoma matsutake 945]
MKLLPVILIAILVAIMSVAAAPNKPPPVRNRLQKPKPNPKPPMTGRPGWDHHDERQLAKFESSIKELLEESEKLPDNSPRRHWLTQRASEIEKKAKLLRDKEFNHHQDERDKKMAEITRKSKEQTLPSFLDLS